MPAADDERKEGRESERGGLESGITGLTVGGAPRDGGVMKNQDWNGKFFLNSKRTGEEKPRTSKEMTGLQSDVCLDESDAYIHIKDNLYFFL